MSSPIPLYRPRDNMWFSYRSSTANSSTASSPSSLHPPPPPPPSPCDSSLDITPRKTSFSMSSGRSSYCAFPSWPNRTALFSDSESESASSYLSDEDLCFTPCPTEYGSPSSSAIMEEDEEEPTSDPNLTMEEQMRLMNSDNERRLRYLSQMHAQARAQQAQRAAQQLAAEVSGTGKRRKRRVGGDKKRRIASASSSTSSSSSSSTRLAA